MIYELGKHYYDVVLRGESPLYINYVDIGKLIKPVRTCRQRRREPVSAAI